MAILTNSQLMAAEETIRDKAAEIINAINVRRDHPTYGMTKAIIRDKAAQLEGMIGLYMVLKGQSAHANVPLLAQFLLVDTTERVGVARKLLESV